MVTRKTSAGQLPEYWHGHKSLERLRSSFNSLKTNLPGKRHNKSVAEDLLFLTALQIPLAYFVINGITNDELPSVFGKCEARNL